VECAEHKLAIKGYSQLAEAPTLNRKVVGFNSLAPPLLDLFGYCAWSNSRTPASDADVLVESKGAAKVLRLV